MHFTRVENLETIIDHGLMSDEFARERGLLAVEIGDHGIKARRARRHVPCPPGGAVSHYAPLYFAPRSPMMYALHRGAYAYRDGFDDVIYLVTSTERVLAAGRQLVVTDRNAVLDLAEFSADEEAWRAYVDWDLMKATMWNDTGEFPDRKERRMAEALVHQFVPFSAFAGIVARTDSTAGRVRGILQRKGVATSVVVRPGWYF